MSTRFNLAHPLIVFPFYIIVLASCFMLDLAWFTWQQTPTVQATWCLFIFGLSVYAPRTLLMVTVFGLCLLSLLVFGSIEPAVLAALIAIALTKLSRTWIDTHLLALLATFSFWLLTWHLLLLCRQHPLGFLYTIKQFCVNVIVLLIMYVIFEKIRHAR